jgi:nitrogen-specific signal transduction histidine kinase
LPSRDVVHGLTEALFSTVRADAMFAWLEPPWGEPPFQEIRFRPGSEPNGSADALSQLLAPALTSGESAAIHTLHDPADNRALRVATVPIGYEDGWGGVAACSYHPDFPSEFELLHLKTGANQAAIALRFNSVQRQLEFLHAAGSQLAASLDYEATLQRLAEVAIPFLGDQCTVHVARDDGSTYQAGLAHVNLAKAVLTRRIRERYPVRPGTPHPITRVRLTGQSQLLAEVSRSLLRDFAYDDEHMRQLDALSPRSAMFVPVSQAGKTLGVLEFVITESHRRFGPTDLRVAEALGRRAALAVSSAKLYREAQDILGREQALRAKAEQLAAEHVAILAHFANQAARSRFGITSDGAQAAEGGEMPHLVSALGTECPPAERPLARAVVHGETIVGMDMCVQCPDGETIPVLVSATPVNSEDGARLGAVMTLHDITTRRALEQQKDEFFANISHDLRTPLAAIVSSIGVVLAHEPVQMPEPIHRMLINIDLAAERMAELVDNLLELTRMQAGRVQLQLARCDVREMASRSARAIEPLASTRAQEVAVTVPEKPVVAVLDVQRMERVLLNLLSNAHKYGHDGGKIQLTVSERPAEVVFSIADNGPGIPEDQLPLIFERFHRVGSETAAGYSGSGLGLAIVQAVVELHDGHISVVSEFGIGSTFTISLPSRVRQRKGRAPAR